MLPKSQCQGSAKNKKGDWSQSDNRGVTECAVLVRVGGLCNRATEPLADMLCSIVDMHAPVIEPPEVQALEEVRLTVGVLEGGVDAVRHPSPHAHVPWVVELNAAVELVVAPVLVAAEEVRLPVVAPHHSGVHMCQAGW